MTGKKTAIIVGAGASAEFGLPTGAGVFRAALQDINASAASNTDGFSFTKGFRHYLQRIYPNNWSDSYNLFSNRILSSTTDSIDRLAWLNPDLVEICKACSAWVLFRASYKSDEQINLTSRGASRWHEYKRDLSHLDPLVGSYQNWIARCANDWLGSAISPAELDYNSLTFITFNYDNIIEEAFAHFVKTTSRFSEVKEADLPNVIHVHGAFPELKLNLNPAEIFNAQNAISYIESGGATDAVQTAIKTISDADSIVSVGFDFDPMNVELIGLQKVASRLHVLNYDGNDAMTNRLLQIGVPEKYIMQGSEESPLGVSYAAARGFFDRPELAVKTSILDAH